MNMHYTHRSHLVHSADHQTFALLQMRRRQLVGLLLIVVGSVWFGLRLFGFVGDPSLPTPWLEGVGLISPLVVGTCSKSELLAVCGMLTTNTNDPIQ